jgi:acyl-CoA synthetase (AMP-forming)/AMP-acid ligase II
MDAPQTIPRILARAAEQLAEHPAIEEAARTLSYRELWLAVQRTAAALIGSGVQPGDRVALWAPNSADWIVLALATSSAGATLVPINTRFKAHEAGYVLAKSRAKLLCTVTEFLGTRYLEQLRTEHGGASAERPIVDLPDLERVVLLESDVVQAAAFVQTLELFRASGADVSADVVQARIDSVLPTHTSDILFTSGTTGQPKGVCTTHQQNVRAYTAWCNAVGLTKHDRYLIVSPFFHAFGYKAGILACLITGATMLPQRVFDAAQVLTRLRRERISVLPGPPTLYQSLLSHPELAAESLPALRLAVTGAAVVPIELIERMRDELGFETIITGYGLTESCGIATMCRDGDSAEIIANTSGRAIEGVEVHVVDSSGRALPAGQPGEVVIRGYNVMQGYFEADCATREAIDAAGFLHTGDVGTLDGAGNLRITDRLKDMYIAGGFNCYPAEIERTMSAHPGIAQVAVIGVPDARLGEVGMAFIVPRPGHFSGATESWRPALHAFCRERMANYKVPRQFAVVSALPVSAAGKVLKTQLRASAGVVQQAHAAHK